MTDFYLIILLPIIWIHFVLSMATLFSTPDNRPVRVVRIGLFTLVTGAMALFLMMKAVFPLTIVVPVLWTILILQGVFRLRWVSEFLFICAAALCIVAIASLATPTTTWGDGYKIIGLVFLPFCVFFSTLLYHQIRFKPLWVAAKMIVGVSSIAACIWLSVTLPPKADFAEADFAVTLVAINAGLIQLIEGIAAWVAAKSITDGV
ncbi:MAG: hypothetical protein JXX29_02340 [Deltaproteobacteria bacterium]|nr:hypothetical protein [Deltaproteobacteria bacterium]MBN2670480.1 hypothetical protein [Deltaproteobacteria bacterium]